MTSTANQEPNFADVIDKLDKVSTDVGQLTTSVDKLSTDVDKLTTEVDKLTTEVDKLSRDSEKFNDRFSNYQQAIQWLVQLAFTLIASATITIIISSVLRR